MHFQISIQACYPPLTSSWMTSPFHHTVVQKNHLPTKLREANFKSPMEKVSLCVQSNYAIACIMDEGRHHIIVALRAFLIQLPIVISRCFPIVIAISNGPGFTTLCCNSFICAKYLFWKTAIELQKRPKNQNKSFAMHCWQHLIVDFYAWNWEMTVCFMNEHTKPEAMTVDHWALEAFLVFF